LIDYSLWAKAIPQKVVGHTEKMAVLNEFEKDNEGIFFSGSYRSGVSVSDCVEFNQGLVRETGFNHIDT